MQFLCPACHTPLPATPPGRIQAVLTCGACSAEVDVSRAGTAAGRPRFVPEIDRTGDRVGSFVLEARIGAGGMGTIYRARQETERDSDGAGDSVAVKFLSPALAGEPDVVARFHREVKTLETLEHPAIVRVLEHGEDGGAPWFAMELVDGSDLRARLAKGPLTLEETKETFVRLFAALGHAHARGIVHRDLKPANVLLAQDGAKLADFGIARLDTQGGSSVTRLTETAAIIGSFPYMSPEQRAGLAVDRRSDLFSAGVMLYEALTGKLPQGAFALPSRLDPRIPLRLDAVVSRLLQPDPGGRYASAADASLELAEALRPRTSMAPVLAGGAVVLLLFALVVPSMMDSGGREGANSSKTAALELPEPGTRPVKSPPSNAENESAIPDVVPTSQTASNSFTGGNEPIFVSKAGSSEDRASSAGQAPNEVRSKSDLAKPTPAEPGFRSVLPSDPTQPEQLEQSTLAPSPTPTAASLNDLGFHSNPLNRAETNYISFVEKQGLDADAEIVVMTTRCNPTLVYKEPTRAGSAISKIPNGTRVERLNRYTRLSFLYDIGGAGRAAGLLGLASSAPPSGTQKDSAPQRKAVDQKTEQLPSDSATKEAVWFFVRYEGSRTGWIEEACATELPPEEVQQQAQPAPQKKSAGKKSSYQP